MLAEDERFQMTREAEQDTLYMFRQQREDEVKEPFGFEH